MSDRLAFLRAIRANPDDDTARLVFADWLDDHADPLGELIRVQIELEPIRYRIDNPRVVELHQREDELLRAHGDGWITTNTLLTNPSDFGPVFRRGLPDYACLSLDTFLKNGEAIFSAYPTLREVALYGVANRCWELTMSPLLANLETLEIADWPTEDDAISLGVSPHLHRISRFKLWTGGEPWLLRELVKQADAKWPQIIELVQVSGGTLLDPEHSLNLNEVTNTLAREANARFGRNAVRVTRPFERVFPLHGDLGFQLFAGHLPDGKPALAAGGTHYWFLATFSEDGRCQGMTPRLNNVRYTRGSPYTAESVMALDAAFREWVKDELQLEPGIIWVREFDEAHVAVSLWPTSLSERIANPSPHPEHAASSEIDWRGRGGEARGWLERRNFVINWGTDYWADWRGVIHSS